MNSAKQNKTAKKDSGPALLLLLVFVLLVGVLMADNYYMPRFNKEFLKLEKERIELTNRLNTARIVEENVDHVRELIFNNMDFPGQVDSINHETQFFNFITSCIDDLKLKLVSIRHVPPVVNERVTTYAYDVEIEGDFFKFGELCAKFENNRRLVSLENFDVDQISDNVTERRGGGEPEFKGIRVKMRINTYRLAGQV